MDQDKVTKFYQFTLFGNFNASSEESIIRAASRRAYRDMCRTLCFNGDIKNDAKKIENEYSAVVTGIFLDEIPKCFTINNKMDFDAWHKKFCDSVISKFEKACEEDKENQCRKFYYGQAQKWVNMTLKYLVMLLDSSKLAKVYPYLHIPIDRIIIERANETLNVPPPVNGKKVVPWSKLNFELYDQYQKDLRSKIGDQAPLDWESTAWIEAQKVEDQPK